MKLAKPHIDIGLFTNAREAQLDFWQNEVGLEFDHVGKLGGGVHQLRHHVNGSILKVNHCRDPLPESAPRAGWDELLIAREGIESPKTLRDPDGNAVTLVKPGTHGVVGIGIRVAANSPGASLAFYASAFGLTQTTGTAGRIGDSVLVFEECPDDMPPLVPPPYKALGFRYVTVQIFKCDEEHARILALGGREGRPPRTIGTTTRYSFILDPDGNWIEVSQRGELAGGLD